MSSDDRAFRLRKLNDTEVYGPMNHDELRQLIDSAYVSPEDEIATGEEENWKVVTEFPEFGMVWKIQGTDGAMYGPTSLGTIREFLRNGEIQFGDKIVKSDEQEPRIISEVLGAEETAALKLEIELARQIAPDEQMEQALETAREVRIRNLEADLQLLRLEFEDLKLKYLKACETLAKMH